MLDNRPEFGAVLADSIRAAEIFAVDPVGIAGVWVRCRSGGAIESWMMLVHDLLAPGTIVKRIPVGISEGRLLGGLDLSATLAGGRPVSERGLLCSANQGVVILPNAESAPSAVVSAVASVLDTGVVHAERDGFTLKSDARFGVIALDEGTETVALPLRERCSMSIDLTQLTHRRIAQVRPDPRRIAVARDALSTIVVPDEIIEGLCAVTVALGVGSSRAALLAVTVARVTAALADRTIVDEDDAALAVRLVLAPRATRFPSEESEPADENQSPPPPAEDGSSDAETDRENVDNRDLEEMLIAAAAARLPSGLLDKLKSGAVETRRPSSAGRSGAKQKAKNYGRRATSRRGDPRDGAPLDILETLRAAAPWQLLRRRELGSETSSAIRGEASRPLYVRREDFRIRTFKNPRETATIFVVDASGSAALHRLAEAKGAIELLLADCYSRRDHVALISFRGKTAELLLPPTRSLTRVKRSLAALPGGGGTPLAAATDAATLLAEAVRRKGMTPAIVFLTDGKANIDKKGQASRVSAEADALEAARNMKATGMAAIVIDTSPPRSGTSSSRFAAEMGARYLPLPYANARALSDAVKAGTR